MKISVACIEIAQVASVETQVESGSTEILA